MLKKYRFAAIVAFVVMIVFIGILSVVFYINQDKFDENKMRVDVFFLNPATNMLEAEPHYINKTDNGGIVNKVFEILYQGPSNKHLIKAQLDGVKIVEAQITDVDGRMVLEVEFSPEYNNMPSLSELFFRVGLVWTMTGLDFITDVNLYVDGQKLLKQDGTQLGLLNRENVVINPIIHPDKIETQTVVLYFANVKLTELYPEERDIQVPDLEPEKYVVQQLIAGPRLNGLVSTIPPETIVKYAKRDGDICYVSLSSDFISKHTGGSTAQNMTIFSIVNSLTELRNVKRVQFLIEGEKIQDFKGGFDLSKPVERDESYLAHIDGD